jgi:hypothetical protein
MYDDIPQLSQQALPSTIKACIRRSGDGGDSEARATRTLRFFRLGNHDIHYKER